MPAARRWGTRTLATVLGAAALVSLLAGSSASAAERPIVYVVVLDGLDGDAVEAGQAPFISSLLAGEGARATYFPLSRSVMPAETNPNHTAMMSGAFPGRSGIAANAFAIYAPLENEDSCAATGPFDPASLPSVTSGENANCPRAELVFEAIHRQGNPDGLLTAGVFGKPKLGRIFAGSHLPGGGRDVDHLWAPCSSGADDDDYCGDVPTNPVSGYALDDNTVMDEVIATMEDGVEARGTTRRPDFTFVNLHQIDSAGHATGAGPIYRAAIGLADDEVERLVASLRARGEWERTVLMLVSDHSMDTTISKLVLTDALVDEGIGEDEFVAVANGSVDLLYLADRRSPERFELLARMREAALAQPGVAEALYRKPNPVDGGRAHTVARAHPDWRSAGARSGDLFVTSKPGIAFSETNAISNPLVGNHGGPQTRDNFLAVVGGGSLVRQRTVAGERRPATPMNVDLAPTVMGLFGLAAPENSKGRFLKRAFARRELRKIGSPPRPRAKLRGRRLVVKPRHSVYDVQARRHHRWRTVVSEGKRWRLRAPGARHAELRVRLVSAAGIAGPWARAR